MASSNQVCDSAPINNAGGKIKRVRKLFTAQFKLNAVKLASVTSPLFAATEIGISTRSISRWLKNEELGEMQELFDSLPMYEDDDVANDGEILVDANKFSEAELAEKIEKFKNSKKPRKTYAIELKMEAISLAKQVGIQAAAKKLDVAENIVRGWMNIEKKKNGGKEGGSSGKRLFRKHSEKTKLEAVQMARATNLKTACKALNIAESTIRRWKQLEELPNELKDDSANPTTSTTLSCSTLFEL